MAGHPAVLVTSVLGKLVPIMTAVLGTSVVTSFCQ
jgi:hypothetical protein